VYTEVVSVDKDIIIFTIIYQDPFLVNSWQSIDELVNYIKFDRHRQSLPVHGV